MAPPGQGAAETVARYVRRVTERQTHERNVGSGFSGSHQLGKTPPRPLPALAFHSLGHPDVPDRGVCCSRRFSRQQRRRSLVI
jgi:hypothetical protein